MTRETGTETFSFKMYTRVVATLLRLASVSGTALAAPRTGAGMLGYSYGLLDILASNTEGEMNSNSYA